ncbi:hypothetical protein [Klebsiella phage ST15-VIM1phi2.1]|nr:hypothetical protein [Klebsiella phage ST15-VIM1phi2.1]
MPIWDAKAWSVPLLGIDSPLNHLLTAFGVNFILLAISAWRPCGINPALSQASASLRENSFRALSS